MRVKWWEPVNLAIVLLLVAATTSSVRSVLTVAVVWIGVRLLVLTATALRRRHLRV